MKIRRIVGPAVLLALASALVLPVHASAQNRVAGRLALDTGVVQIDGKPGGVSSDRFKLINASQTALTVQSFVEDLATDANGDVVAAPRRSGLPSAAEWVKVNAKEIDVPASGVATVDVTITVPKDVKAGGYYASVTFDVDDRSAPESRLTHAILVRILGAGATASARLVSFEMNTPTYSGKVEMKVTVENLGRIHAIGAGRIDVTDTFGNRIAQVPVPTVVVMPGRQRIVRVVYDSPPVAGRLKATAVMSFDGTESLASDTGYVLIWWLVAALTAVLVLFLLALMRIAGLAGPKAAARRAARAAAAPPPVAAPIRERKRGRKKDETEQMAAASAAPPLASPPPSTPPLRMPPPAPSGIIPPGGPPPMPPGVAPPGALPPSAPPVPPPPVKPDQSFWGPDDDEAPAPRVRDEPDVEPVEEPEPVTPAPASSWALDPLTDDDDDDFEDDDFEDESDEGESDEGDEGDDDDFDDDDEEDEDDEDRDEVDSEEEPGEEPDEPATPAARPLPSDDEPDAAWPAAAASGTPPPPPARPVPVVLPPGRRPSPGPAAADDDDEATPPLKPAGREPRQIHVAGLPPLRQPETLPASQWTPPPTDQPLERPAGGSAMALRRAEVALRMIGGKTGETGAILDSGLDLLYSVRNDPDVVARVEQAYEETRNRRRLGPLALALFAVDSRVAPEALLDSYATASKVVAERIRRAILACDPADIRRHKDLIQALPQGRRDQLGL